MLNNLKELNIFNKALYIAKMEDFEGMEFEINNRDIYFSYHDQQMDYDDLVTGIIYFKLGKGIRVQFNNCEGDYSKGDRAYENILNALELH